MTTIIPEHSRYEVGKLYDGQRIRAPWWKRILELPHTIELVDGPPDPARDAAARRARDLRARSGRPGVVRGRVGDEGVLWPG
jgi:hypothetical protein